MSIIDRLLRPRRTYADTKISDKQIDESIRRARVRGISAPEYGFLGVAFCALRIDKKLTVDELAGIAGVNSDQIIDLETCSLHINEAIELTAKLIKPLGIDTENYKAILLQSSMKMMVE